MNVYEGDEKYIFVSYAHKDSERVLPALTMLQKEGFRVWFDTGIEAGYEWAEYIANHLDKSCCFLVFLSEASNASANCRREIHRALKIEKDMLIVYLEDCSLSPGLEMQLDILQAIRRSGFGSEELFHAAIKSAKLLQPCRATSPSRSMPDEEREREDEHEAQAHAEDDAGINGGVIAEAESEAEAEAEAEAGAEAEVEADSGAKTGASGSQLLLSYQFDEGYMLSAFARNSPNGIMEFNKPFILMVDDVIHSASFVKFVSIAIQRQPLLVIARGVNGSALERLANKSVGGLPICVVKAPGYGDFCTGLIGDIAAVTGATVLCDVEVSNIELLTRYMEEGETHFRWFARITKEYGLEGESHAERIESAKAAGVLPHDYDVGPVEENLQAVRYGMEDIKAKTLGRAEAVWVSAKSTRIDVCSGREEVIEQRIVKIQREIKEARSAFEREDLFKRIDMLSRTLA